MSKHQLGGRQRPSSKASKCKGLKVGEGSVSTVKEQQKASRMIKREEMMRQKGQNCRTLEA